MSFLNNFVVKGLMKAYGLDMASCVLMIMSSILEKEAKNRNIEPDNIRLKLKSNKQEEVTGSIYNHKEKVCDLPKEALNDLVNKSEFKIAGITLPEIQIGDAVFMIIHEIIEKQAVENKCEIEEISATILNSLVKDKAMIIIRKEGSQAYVLDPKLLNKYLNINDLLK
ncbi:MAG: hypothetical protein WCT85_01535 [Parachlamydiales bacterium]|jgi:hypothetical protein